MSINYANFINSYEKYFSAFMKFIQRRRAQKRMRKREKMKKLVFTLFISDLTHISASHSLSLRDRENESENCVSDDAARRRLHNIERVQFI